MIDTTIHYNYSLIRIKHDCLTVSYLGIGNHTEDYGIVIGNHQNWFVMNPQQQNASSSELCYYELEIVSKGERGEISMGVIFLKETIQSISDIPLSDSSQCVGKLPDSVGYRGDSGILSLTSPSRVLERTLITPGTFPKFGTGDIVGCGIFRGDVFFTRNGKMLGNSFKISSRRNVSLFRPIVSLHSSGETVRFRYPNETVSFDVYSMMKQENEKQRKGIYRMQVPTRVTDTLVHDFLRFHGYENTLRALNEKSPALSSETFDVGHRKQVKRFILEGQPLSAFSYIRSNFTELSLDSWPNPFLDIACRLKSQEFIELLNKSPLDLTPALNFAQDELPMFLDSAPNISNYCTRVLSLLAYSPVETSPEAHLLQKDYRLQVADDVNRSLNQLLNISATDKVDQLQSHLQKLIGLTNKAEDAT